MTESELLHMGLVVQPVLLEEVGPADNSFDRPGWVMIPPQAFHIEVHNYVAHCSINFVHGYGPSVLHHPGLLNPADATNRFSS